MFTGLIEEIGHIAEVKPMAGDLRLRVECQRILEGIARGDSIAVDGVCLTVEEFDARGFTMYASPETMAKTSLGERRPGDGVNLERALSLSTRLGGHLVSGHVDATGSFASARKVEKAWELRVEAPAGILQRSIPKGSITIDGISLTIVDLTDREISCWIIPETWERTTLHQKRPGQKINLEADLIGKYVWRYMEMRGGAPDPAEKDKALRELLGGGNWGVR